MLFSRDLRHGTHLALPRPAARVEHLRPGPLGLAARSPCLVFLLLPILILYAGGAARRARRLRADQRGRGRRCARPSLLALALTGHRRPDRVSWSTRRGFAVVATIAVLLIGNGIVTAIQGISDEEGRAAASARSPGCSRRTRSTAGCLRLGRHQRAADTADRHGHGGGLPRRVPRASPPACLGGLLWRYRKLAWRERHEHDHPRRPGVALVRQRRRRQRHLDDRRARHHRPARPQRRRARPRSSR